MKIYGIDFTSAPREAKPITCAVCSISANQLVAEDVWAWTSLQEFEQFLEHEGPWTAAVDFPIGQPRRLIEALDWPTNWKRVRRTRRQHDEARIRRHDRCLSRRSAPW